jgi:spoIIIJ-associated protein
MSHGESAAAGTRDDQPPRPPEDAAIEDPPAGQALSGDPAGEADAAGGAEAEAPWPSADAADPGHPDLEEPGDPDLEEPGDPDLEEPGDPGLEEPGSPVAGPAWSDGASRGDGERGAEVTVADLEQEGEIAADYIEGLLDIADLDGDIDMDVEGDRALVSVVGGTLDELVGNRGVVLEALQELTRLAVQRQTGERTRMMLDVGGYRARRREELTVVGREAADEVRQTGAPKRLTPMTAFERKIVHDAVAAAGLHSESEGEEPDRRVVVYPAG